MLSRAAIRTSQAVAGRRAFHVTARRFSSPYHYPEGPYSNLPFNPKGKFFGVGYWGTMFTFFFMPFGIAGMFSSHGYELPGLFSGVIWASTVWANMFPSVHSLADVQAEIDDLFPGFFR